MNKIQPENGYISIEEDGKPLFAYKIRSNHETITPTAFLNKINHEEDQQNNFDIPETELIVNIQIGTMPTARRVNINTELVTAIYMPANTDPSANDVLAQLTTLQFETMCLSLKGELLRRDQKWAEYYDPKDVTAFLDHWRPISNFNHPSAFQSFEDMIKIANKVLGYSAANTGFVSTLTIDDHRQTITALGIDMSKFNILPLLIDLVTIPDERIEEYHNKHRDLIRLLVLYPMIVAADDPTHLLSDRTSKWVIPNVGKDNGRTSGSASKVSYSFIRRQFVAMFLRLLFESLKRSTVFGLAPIEEQELLEDEESGVTIKPLVTSVVPITSEKSELPTEEMTELLNDTKFQQTLEYLKPSRDNLLDYVNELAQSGISTFNDSRFRDTHIRSLTQAWHWLLAYPVTDDDEILDAKAQVSSLILSL